MPDVMTRLVTVEEFMAMPDDGRRVELVRGEVQELAPSFAVASVVGSNVIALLIEHVRPRKLGRVFMDGTTFALIPHRHSARSPDVAFIRAERLPPGGFPPRQPVRIPPDLAVEVLSPSETKAILEDKLDDYREAGTPLIWVVDPDTRTVEVRAADAPSYTLAEGDTLTGAPVLPEFRCAVAELFEGVARA
jgi:Uma2 family endonuclease